MLREFVGIDPGLDGAIALLRGPEEIVFFDTPTLEVAVRPKRRREYDVSAIAGLLRKWASEANCRNRLLTVAIEKQQVMPAIAGNNRDGQGQKGSFGHFQTGLGYGILIGVCAGCDLPFTVIAPMSWKAELLRDMPKGKDSSRVAAMRLFPVSAKGLQRKKDHARADALLIAECARRRMGA